MCSGHITKGNNNTKAHIYTLSDHTHNCVHKSIHIDSEQNTSANWKKACYLQSREHIRLDQGGYVFVGFVGYYLLVG